MRPILLPRTNYKSWINNYNNYKNSWRRALDSDQESQHTRKGICWFVCLEGVRPWGGGYTFSSLKELGRQTAEFIATRLARTWGASILQPFLFQDFLYQGVCWIWTQRPQHCPLVFPIQGWFVTDKSNSGERFFCPPPSTPHPLNLQFLLLLPL